MELRGKRLLVTGGAGFIGSHLVEQLLTDGNEITVVDDLSNGCREWVSNDVEFVEGDLTAPGNASSVVTPEFDAVVHLAARKDPNDDDPRRQFANNTSMTHAILDAAREAGVTNVAYTSSSTVYGEARRPTPEEYGPLEPISEYGASKLADEGLLSTYAHSYGFTVWNFRFANVVGPRLRGAVIPDFIGKLRENTESLSILGDGRQEKSYLYVDDCTDAIRHVIENAQRVFDPAPTDGCLFTVNLGTRTATSVTRIADIVTDVLDVDPTYEYTGGKRGWTGDVSRMQLSIEKITALGWEPTYESDEAVRHAAIDLADEFRF